MTLGVRLQLMKIEAEQRKESLGEIFGIPVIQDSDLPDDEVRFVRDKDGKVLARITGLAK